MIGKTKLRVVHVLPNLGAGGAEFLTLHICKHLANLGFSVTLVTLFSPGGEDISIAFEQKQRLLEAGVQVVHLNKHKGFDPRMYYRLYWTLNNLKPQIVHSHRYVLRYLLPSIIMRQAQIWVHTVHNIAEKEVDRFGRWVHRIAFKIGVIPVAISQEVSQSVKRIYGLKDLPIIPNGIDLTHYADKGGRRVWRAREGYKDDDILFVSIARMSPQKDHFSLIRAFSIAASYNNRIKLLLVGDGLLRPELEAQVRVLGLEDKVRFLGVRLDIPEILSAADGFILSSRWEGNPISVMEAMAAGKPVIATAVGGVPELIEQEKTGILIPPGDFEALAQAILRVACDMKLRFQLGEASKATAIERFDIMITVREYVKLYLNLIEEKLHGHC